VHFYEALGITLRSLYAKTALSGVATLDMDSKPLIGYAGKAVEGIKIRATNGILEVSGPNVFQGYVGKEAAGEWFSTGDAGEVDASGNVRVLGCAASSFKLKNGAVVHPEEIELKLRSSPLVAGVVCFGKGREFPGAILAIEREALASAAKRAGKTTDELAQSPETLSEIDKHVQEINKGLSDSHKVRKYRVIAREFTPDEVTSTMLLQRSVVLAKYESLIEELYNAYHQQNKK
jgi:long-chain acyl-CoA synthetase